MKARRSATGRRLRLGVTLPPGRPRVSPLSPSQARAGLEARRLAISSFQLQGEISVKTSQGELNGDHLILGKFPDRLRAQVLGPFGRPLLTLVSDGYKLVVLDYDRNQLLHLSVQELKEKGATALVSCQASLSLPSESRSSRVPCSLPWRNWSFSRS